MSFLNTKVAGDIFAAVALFMSAKGPEWLGRGIHTNVSLRSELGEVYANFSVSSEGHMEYTDTWDSRYFSAFFYAPGGSFEKFKKWLLQVDAEIKECPDWTPNIIIGTPAPQEDSGDE